MTLYSRLLRRWVLPYLGRVYNPDFPRFYRRLEESQYWDHDRLERYRWGRFRKLLEHAAGSVPFYQAYFRQAGLSLEDFRDFRDLAKLPVLGKDDYQRHGLEGFLSTAVDARDTVRDSTSGTTGQPFAFYLDGLLVASKMARLLRENRWAGWEPGERYIRIWGPHQETLSKRFFYDVLMRRNEISAFQLERDFESVEARFLRIRPRVVEAYTSAAVHLARLLRDRQRSLPPPRSVIVSAETLTLTDRSLIEEHLGGQVFNRYGSREMGNIAHECGSGGLHVNAESFHVEEEEHAEIEGARNLVITLFDNYAMPFLRYRIGDVGRLSSNSCACGRELPLLESVAGRTTDFFALSSGQLLSFLFFNHFFEQYGGLIDRYQVEQLDGDRLQIRLLRGPEFSEEVPTGIQHRLDDEFNGSPGFEVLVVDELSRGPSGKQQLYIPLPRARRGAGA